ncbi:MAG: regulatory protein GemA [Rhizobiaceae bacterium]|nr:regulatory protein GemA [Rhizobiaceae bacterium]
MTSIAILHVAKRELGLDDDTYRDVLERATGQRSAKGLSEPQRRDALTELRRLGFVPRPNGGTRASAKGKRVAMEGKYAGKLQALWIAAWNLGIVRNRDDKALIAFVRRQTGVDDTRFLYHADDGAKAIEALKGWLAREGGVDWTRKSLQPLFTQLAGYRIALAQFEKLTPDQMPGEQYNAFLRHAQAISGKAPHFMAEEQDWQPVMNALGQALRATKKGKRNV